MLKYFAFAGFVALAVACGAGEGGRAASAGGSGASANNGGSSSSGGLVITGGGPNINPCDPVCVGPGPAGCGNGELTDDEACDDGNTADGDGCTANCLSVEPGYSCSPPGVPCHVVALCGDGVVASNEMCDDDNFMSGDGCSDRCKLEIGFKCDGMPSICTPTTCGDGVQEGAEGCDDGNAIPLDGCSVTCQAEPDCSLGSCTSDCGDRLVINEGCDDGNTLDGDGCSSACEPEPGFTCTQQVMCEMVNGECVLRVPVVYRDFQASGDFRGCSGSPRPPIVATLTNGKPVMTSGFNPACIESPASFAEWYTDNAKNHTIPSSMLLFDNAAGGYVNHWGPNGERWVNQAGMELDGNPVFLPIDDAPNAFMDTRQTAQVPPPYTDGTSWREETFFFPDAGATHNFSFSTEVGYWFRFDAGFSAQLDFLGDDDVWVFVNGVLALDLGGTHVPEAGQVTIDDATATTYGLSPGNVYSIKVFHAERNPHGSSFKLTLSGFENAPSECVPFCGDGIVSLGEECDDGMNDGGYGECEPMCKVGPRCGDNILQEGEDCDDGNRLDGDGCGSACRNVVVQ